MGLVVCWRWTMAGQVSNLGRLAAGHQSVLASEPPLTSGLEHTKRGRLAQGYQGELQPESELRLGTA